MEGKNKFEVGLHVIILLHRFQWLTMTAHLPVPMTWSISLHHIKKEMVGFLLVAFLNY